MDALALLCNLHADGPRTLHCLRTAGFESVLDVMELEPEELEDLLGWKERAIHRFQREAEVLADRLEEGILEVEEEEEEYVGADHLVGEESESADDDIDDHDDLDEDDEDDGLDEELEGLTVETPEDEEEEGILETWAALDESAPPDGPECDLASEMVELPEEEAPFDPLEAGVCEGFTEELVERLRRAGITTFSDLVRGNTLELAGWLDLGYTRMLRLQFLARRHLDVAPKGTDTRTEETSVDRDVIPTPDPQTERLDASGPFA